MTLLLEEIEQRKETYLAMNRRGCSEQQIADQLGVSISTLKDVKSALIREKKLWADGDAGQGTVNGLARLMSINFMP